MKRIVQFKNTDVGYACFEGENKVFEISSSDLQFDVKQFYQAFYSDDKAFEDIEIENCVSEDSNARRIYQCITELMSNIKDKLADMPNENDDIAGNEEVPF